MPDENSSQQPPKSSDKAHSRARQTITGKSIQEGIAAVGHDVHWTTHATFWSQVALGIIAILALVIYHGQLRTMNDTYVEIRNQTKAAQSSEYMACLSARSAQLSLAEAKKTTAFSQSMALSAANQAAAETGTEGAVIQITPRVPTPEEFNRPMLNLPYSIRNDGKSAAVNLEIEANAVLLGKYDVLSFKDNHMGQIKIPRFGAGQEIPPTTTTEGYKIPSLAISVRDAKGDDISTSEPIAQAFISGADHGSTVVFIFGKIQYSDFSGTHKQKFCNAVGVIKRGDSKRGSSPNEQTCGRYISEQDYPLNAVRVPSFSPSAVDVPQITCIAPKE